MVTLKCKNTVSAKFCIDNGILISSVGMGLMEV